MTVDINFISNYM